MNHPIQHETYNSTGVLVLMACAFVFAAVIAVFVIEPMVARGRERRARHARELTTRYSRHKDR